MDAFRFYINNGPRFGGPSGAHVLLRAIAPTATVPNVIPYGNDSGTGLGRAGADQLSLIAGGVEAQRLSETNGELNITFGGTQVESITNATTAAAAATLTKAAEDFDVTCSVGDIVLVTGGTDAADYGTYIVKTVTSATVLTVDRNFANTNTDVDFVVISNSIAIENSRDATAKLVLPKDDDATAPTLSFCTNGGFYAFGSTSVRFASGGSFAFTLSNKIEGSAGTGGCRVGSTAGTVTAPTYSFTNDTNTGGYRSAADNYSITAGGLEAARFEDPADLGATETSLWLYDDDNGTIEQVTVGAADSGGTNFKVLRIPN